MNTPIPDSVPATKLWKSLGYNRRQRRRFAILSEASQAMFRDPDLRIADLHTRLTQRYGQRAMRRTFGRYSLSGMYTFFCEGS